MTEQPPDLDRPARRAAARLAYRRRTVRPALGPAGGYEGGYERAGYVTALQAANSHAGPW